VRNKKAAKSDATEVARALLNSALSKSAGDLELAKEQGELARRVMLRFNVRFDYSLRRFLCHGCKKLIVPGVNATVRLGRGRPGALRVTCLECGHVNRKILAKNRTAVNSANQAHSSSSRAESSSRRSNPRLRPKSG
jgi:RNase P subunit RPR2